MENDQSTETIVTAGYACGEVEKVSWMINIDEYKRRQAPVGKRVARRSFGEDWR